MGISRYKLDIFEAIVISASRDAQLHDTIGITVSVAGLA